MNNYDIEMWRYSNLLKRKSPNEIMNFEHKKTGRIYGPFLVYV